MVNDGAPDGMLRRGLRMGALGLKLTNSYLGYRLQNLLLGSRRRDERRGRLQQIASRRIRQELESLKGPVMKLGQMLSMQSHVLPPEAIAELSNLQMQAPPMHPTLARAQFKASCGRYPDEAFESFEPTPFAAASLGQVHRAVTKDGRRVAVKIQYPAIRQAVRSDLKLLRSAAWTARIAADIPKSAIDEIETHILQETDYLNEGRNIDFFREGLRPLAWVELPSVLWDLTTDRVLTMSHLDGALPGEFLARRPPQRLRDLLGIRLADLFSYEIHVLHALQADHHPGNFLFSDDGRIGLVDFGCVKRLAPEIVELTRTCHEHRWEEGDEQFGRMAKLAFGPAAAGGDKARRLLSSAIQALHLILPPTGGGPHVLDFADGGPIRRLLQVWNQAFQSKLINPQFVMLARAELGLYNLLHLLRAKVDLSQVMAFQQEHCGPTAARPAESSAVRGRRRHG